MDMYQRMVELNPNRNPVFTAIEQLETTEEIREFYGGYIKVLKRKTGLVDDDKDEPKAVANSNIGYVLGYYDSETADRWMKALSQVSHPVFGRKIPFNEPETAYKAGLAERLG